MTWAYYNEFDPYAAQWLRNLIAAARLRKRHRPSNGCGVHPRHPASQHEGRVMVRVCSDCGQTIPAMPEGLRIEDNLIFTGDKVYRVTLDEARALSAIASRHPRTAGIHDILESMYGLEVDWPGDNIIRVHMHRLRKKTEGAPFAITAVRGGGYRLVMLGENEPRPNPRHHIRWM